MSKLVFTMVVLLASMALARVVPDVPVQPPGSIPSILFLGDSNTELASYPETLGFQVQFTKDYIRKADIINRGHSGWNTHDWVDNLQRLVADWSPKPPSLVVIMMGSNDAALPDGWNHWQHVPLDTYASNVQTLVSSIQGNWSSRILLVTPLPFDDQAPAWQGSRTNAAMGQYAAKIATTAQLLDVPVLDLWTSLQDSIATIFYDGLHLNRDGNLAVHNRMRDAIASAYPSLAPANLPIYYP
ncbi:Aste57867_8244 [Aphanomyces stellatus]|uniref:Aste57867_8244 protein n=1 Tax=Aphanomyces stellatus TaxID=120398 RepID=A0A485KJT1_9STRA|nr:hypothetical protein As57867_008213 [Aphanomyces stellatus]VFT85131.1 Aste57867_8244 [Aphanomyces stellatus]